MSVRLATRPTMITLEPADTPLYFEYQDGEINLIVPCYLEMLSKPNRAEVISRPRDLASNTPVYVWDLDSYDISPFGMSDPEEAVEFIQ